jgi:transcriptional regulator with XRE-family HTH domain
VAGIGERLQELRKERGWTQQELADRSGIKRGYIALLESNRRRSIGARNALKLAGAFGITVDELLREKKVLIETPPLALVS